MTDGAVLRLQPRWIFVEELTGGKAAQYVGDSLFVRMEALNRLANIFVGRVAKRLIVRRICTQDRSIGADEVQPDSGVLKEILKIEQLVDGRSLSQGALSPQVLSAGQG